MKRCAVWTAVLAFIVLLGTLGLRNATASSPFDQKLSPDQQILHALNRLAFGPRPGDVEQVRQMGVAKWIEMQLHPDQIPENPLLKARLKPLDSLNMDLATVVREYNPDARPNPAGMNMITTPVTAQRVNIAPFQQIMRTGTPEVRMAVLKAVDAEQRKAILETLPPNITDTLPAEFKQEADEARRERQEQIQMQNRTRNPLLSDLLTPDQLLAINSGNPAQMIGVITFLDPDKRSRVLNQLPLQRLAEVPELRRQKQLQQQPRQVVSEDLKEAKVFRAIYSNRQLQEVLVDFWMNHFNVDVEKAIQSAFFGAPNMLHPLISSYERDAIRPYVFGHFKDLLVATAHHPAMLYYLDNWESMGRSFEVGPFAPRIATLNGVPNSIVPGPLEQYPHGLNENYGREIMELHTLGVKGGYTQDDVINVARCFTGWTVRGPQNPEFTFAPFMHDMGEKTVLGHKIAAGGGQSDGETVLDILERHPSTAAFISRELAQRFVADDPPQALVDRMAQTFMKTDGDLRAVMETMFTSPEFFSQGAWQSKIKSPFEMLASAARALDLDVTDAYPLVQKLADMGEPLYNKLPPTGYLNTGESWLSSQGIMGRISFSTAVASGSLPGVTLNPAILQGKDAPAIAHALLGRDPSPETLAAIEQGASGQGSAKDLTPPFLASMVLSSPDFQRR